MLLVEILAEFLEDRLKLGLVEVGVDLLGEQLLHLVKIGGVEARGEEVFGSSLLDAVTHLLDAGLGVDIGGGCAHGEASGLGGSLDARGGQRGSLARAHAQLGGLSGGAGGHGGGAHGGSHLLLRSRSFRLERVANGRN